MEKCWICGRSEDEVKKIIIDQMPKEIPEELRKGSWTYALDVDIGIDVGLTVNVKTPICAICWCLLLKACQC